MPGSSSQEAIPKMYQLHKMRGQSVKCPACGHGKDPAFPVNGMKAKVE